MKKLQHVTCFLKRAHLDCYVIAVRGGIYVCL